MAGRYLHDVQVVDGLCESLAYWRDGAVILDVGNGIKGGTPEKYQQSVSNYPFQLRRTVRLGLARGTHAVYRYKNYLFIGDEAFRRHSAWRRTIESPCAASHISWM